MPPETRYQLCDPDMRIVVLDGAQVTLADTAAWLDAIGRKYPSAAYLVAIGHDILSTAVEPWP